MPHLKLDDCSGGTRRGAENRMDRRRLLEAPLARTPLARTLLLAALMHTCSAAVEVDGGGGCYAYRRPVILTGVSDNMKFRLLCSKTNLLSWFGDRTVRLSTANTYSYKKVDVPFQEYVDFLLKPQPANALGSDTLYFFGDNNFTEWSPLFDQYQPPPYLLPGTTPAFSFGLAGPGTGVPFHWHGAGFSEVLYGRKRWFLYPPDQEPHFHPNRSTLSWLEETYPLLPPEEAPLECTIRPGEVLFFPDRWWHATLNLDTSVFMSTFLG